MTCANSPADFQAAFSTALLDPAALAPADIVTRNGVDPARRFGIYRNNVIIALINALADSYPVVAALVGAEFFRAMARQFARRHPPRSPVMAEYGDGFADFIAAFSPAKTLPYLADVARLEWQYVRAWHAADAVPLLPEQIAHLVSDPAGLAITRWHFHPSAALVDSPCASVSIWHAHQQPDTAAVEAALGNIVLEEPEAALVLRQGLGVVVLPLTPAEAAFIRALLAGENLAAAMECALLASAQFDVRLTFALLLRSGALVAFH